MNPVDLVIEMLEKKESLTKGGVPKISALSAKLGEDVTDKQRDAWVEEAKAKIEEKKKQPKVQEIKQQPKTGVISSGLGSW